MNSLSHNSRPAIIGVGGLSSEVGKTTLLCKLLKAFPGWEAIKTTRGHYRSCGKDPHSCCVSDLLSSEPTINSGRELTYAKGKDTGRYWDAGAANVHWVIATDEQVQKGINEALERVIAPGVFIEGNSFTQYVTPDFFVMVAEGKTLTMKRTARLAISRASVMYVSNVLASDDIESVSGLLRFADVHRGVEILRGDQFGVLVSRIRAKISRLSTPIDNRFTINSSLDSPDHTLLTISE